MAVRRHHGAHARLRCIGRAGEALLELFLAGDAFSIFLEVSVLCHASDALSAFDPAGEALRWSVFIAGHTLREHVEAGEADRDSEHVFVKVGAIQAAEGFLMVAGISVGVTCIFGAVIAGDALAVFGEEAVLRRALALVVDYVPSLDAGERFVLGACRGVVEDVLAGFASSIVIVLPVGAQALSVVVRIVL